MSTNYYWLGDKPLWGRIRLPSGEETEYRVDLDDPKVHVGKRYSLGEGRLGFAWAQDPQTVNKICLSRMDDDVMVDEYGVQYTGRKFLRTVANRIDSDDVSTVGTAFS